MKQDPEAGQNMIEYLSWKFEAFWTILILKKYEWKKTIVFYIIYE